MGTSKLAMFDFRSRSVPLDRTDNALELCRDNMMNKLSPELYFLSAVAYSYDYKHMNRLMELVT